MMVLNYEFGGAKNIFQRVRYTMARILIGFLEHPYQFAKYNPIN